MTEMLNNKIAHNKKRNIGLIYEFFSRYIAKAILESRQNDVEKAKILIRKHFNKSTDLYRELRLFKTLYETRVTNRDAAVHLVNRVRDVVKNQSQARLDLEKTGLIHEINQTLTGQDFFNQNITDYKLFGTIQILLNSWRNPETLNENIGTVTQFEEILFEHLMSPKKTQIAESNTETDKDVNKLVVDIMADKVNKKFDNLNEDQKKIVSLYVLQEESEPARKELELILEGLRDSVKSIIARNKNEGIVIAKLDEVNEMLDNDYKDIKLNDEVVTFYLGISKLEKELLNG